MEVLQDNPITLCGSYKDQYASVLAFDSLEKSLAQIDLDTLPKSHVNVKSFDKQGLPKPAAAGENTFKSPNPKDLQVCIIGAGIGGLFTAHILDVLGIRYDFLEASNREGGRLLTHYFSDPETAKTKHDYYDIGAMRFPETPIMEQLFKKVGFRKNHELLPYYMQSNHQPMRYNDRTTFFEEGQEKPEDPFHVSIKNHGDVPDSSVRDADNILNDAYDYYRSKIKRDAVTGFHYLLKHDKLSLRDYLANVEDQDRNTIDWLETLNSATGWFDLAFTENVLDSLAFDWADPKPDNAPKPDSTTQLPTQTSSGTLTSNKSSPDIGEKDVKWWCINGGTERLVRDMLSQGLIKNKPRLSRRVVSMALKDIGQGEKRIEVTHVRDGVAVNGDQSAETKSYDSVISSAPLGALQKIDLTQMKLPYNFKTSIRGLRYDTSTKVGIMFKKAWWIKNPKPEHDFKGLRGVKGGLGKTDMPLRVCVYPSYNVKDDPDQPAVLLCSYSWGQDSERIAALVNEESPTGEQTLKDLMLHDLARLHSTNDDEFKIILDMITELYQTHHAYDWSKNKYTGGAFALFAPGNFRSLYGSLVRPTADSRFHIVGEAVSAHHAWIVGALESAMRGVWNFLERFKLKDLQDKMTSEFGRSFEIDYERAYLAVALGMSGVLKKGQKPE